jgi:hypothetical protein
MRLSVKARTRPASGRLRPIFTGALAAASVALAAAGCGDGQNHAGSVRHRAGSPHTFASRGVELTALTPVWLQPSPLQHAAPARLYGAAIGVAQSVNTRGAALRVTVNAVIDPLRGSGAQLPDRTRAVAVYVQLRNHGPAAYNSSATADFTLTVSRGLVTPLLVPHGLCRTPLNDFDRQITAGEDRVGCVAFSVAQHARVEAVRFSPHAQSTGRLSWQP